MAVTGESIVGRGDGVVCDHAISLGADSSSLGGSEMKSLQATRGPIKAKRANVFSHMLLTIAVPTPIRQTTWKTARLFPLMSE